MSYIDFHFFIFYRRWNIQVKIKVGWKILEFIELQIKINHWTEGENIKWKKVLYRLQFSSTEGEKRGKKSQSGYFGSVAILQEGFYRV